jgi:cell division protein FtsL
MTAQPLRHPRARPGLRVVAGKKAARPAMGPWVVFSMVAIVAFLGMVATRTSLDRSAIELSGIEADIAEARSTNQLLRLEIGRLESPARVAPLAREMGMIYPDHSQRLLVAGVHRGDSSDPRWAEIGRMAATLTERSTEVVATDIATVGVDQPQAAASLVGETTGDDGGDQP